MSSSHFLNSIRNRPNANRSSRSTEPFRSEREFQPTHQQTRIDRDYQQAPQQHVLDFKNPDSQDANSRAETYKLL